MTLFGLMVLVGETSCRPAWPRLIAACTVPAAGAAPGAHLCMPALAVLWRKDPNQIGPK